MAVQSCTGWIPIKKKEQSTKRKLKFLEKSLDLEKEKIEKETFETRNEAIAAQYKSRFDERGHISNGKNLVVSKSSSGHFLLAENTLQNGSIDNYKSTISNHTLDPLIYKMKQAKTFQYIVEKILTIKNLKVTEASNPKTWETYILIHKQNGQNFRDFIKF